MSKFYIYVFKIFFKYNFIVLIFVTAVTMLYSIISRADKLKDYNATIFQMIRLELLTLPIEMRNALSIVLVVSIIITILLLVRSNELLAYVSIGGKLQKFMMIFVFAAILLTVLMIFFDSRLNTFFRTAQRRYQTEVIQKQPYIPGSESLINIWTVDNSKLINIEYVDVVNSVINNITEYNLDSSFRVSFVRHIENAKHDNDTNKWVLNKIKIDDFLNSQVVFYESAEEDNQLFSDIGSFLPKSSRNMSLSELSDMINFLKSRGLSSIRFEMILLEKYASALSNIVLSILVVPLGVSFSRRYSPVLSALVSLGIGAAFWIALATFNGLGYSGHIPPIPANFIPHILFLIIGLLILYRKEKAQ